MGIHRGSGPLGSGPTGPGSGFSVMPPCTNPWVTQGQGHVTVNKTCYLYDLYCFPHVAIVFCSDFGGWGESNPR